jgi:hypothetical protein
VARRTVNFLPNFYRTDANEKFLNATLDQLVSEPNLKKVGGYIGRRDASTFKAGDSYISEPSAARTNYQLEPSVISKNSTTGKIEHIGIYTDMINRIKYHGGNTTNHDILFNNEYYGFGEIIDTNKLVNFSQYYWLADGPDVVDIFTGSIDLTKDFNITRNATDQNYTILGETGINPELILARGGTYTFRVAQDSNNFWIQTEQGIDGQLDTSPNISTREVFGVTNNGDDVGEVTFTVPENDAQDDFVLMTKVDDVNLATTIPFKDLANQTYDNLITNYGGIDGLQNIDGKTMVFVGDFVESDWQAEGIFDLDPFDQIDFDQTQNIPVAQRTAIFRITLVSNGDTEVVRITYETDIPQEQKVTVTEGDVYSNREIWHDNFNKLDLVPIITANLNVLYYHDENNALLTGVIRLVNIAEPLIIDIENDILGKPFYTAPNGVVFTNGLKVKFDSFVISSTYVNNEYYVEGVGDSIRLVDVSTLTIYSAEPADKNYFTINRSSPDGNQWSRENRWFHEQVIQDTATYNKTTFTVDQSERATRPIVEYKPDIKLFNYGYTQRGVVDLIDTIEVDALSNFNGSFGGYIDGVVVTDGMSVIFSADTDATVVNKIYRIDFVDPQKDSALEVQMVEIGTVVDGDVVVVSNGLSSIGKSYWFDGTDWSWGQPKTTANQEPLFDVFDQDGNSFGEISVYPLSSFVGSKLVSYDRGTGNNDEVLGIPIAHRNINNVGDILFENYFETDTFVYLSNDTSTTRVINDGFIKKFSSPTAYTRLNMWSKVKEETAQFQSFSYISDGGFDYGIDQEPKAHSLNNIKVWVDNVYQTNDKYTIENVSDTWIVRFVTAPISLAKVDIKVYAALPIASSYYNIPDNLNLNALNDTLSEFTLGQLRNHVTKIATNVPDFSGTQPGNNNLRDRLYQTSGGTILQHSAPLTLPLTLLTDPINDMIESLRYNQLTYENFKHMLIDKMFSMDIVGLSFSDAIDAILEEIDEIKDASFPFNYTDMIAHGNDVTLNTWTVVNPNDKEYEYGTILDMTVASNRGVLVYLNGVQLFHERDYTFLTTRSAIKVDTSVTLAYGDTIVVKEYDNTDGSFVPATPTKLGMWPKFEPEKFTDDTYVTPIDVIRGHDGSITIAFGDFRDDLLLEYETRVYNNIKTTFDTSRIDFTDIVPGKFRNTEFTLADVNNILGPNFLQWTGAHHLNFTTQTGFNSSDRFTLNYSEFGDRIDGELLIGNWRGIYRYFYDTERPHTHPWEMLGLTIKPTWWNTRYGPAPYTSGNLVLWNDLRDGKLYTDGTGSTYSVLANYTRADLLTVIPVDTVGTLLSPLESIVKNFNSTFVQQPYEFGDVGPTESAWRRSSMYPFAMQMVYALTQPAKFFGLNIDIDEYSYDTAYGQWVTSEGKRFVLSDITVSGETINGVIQRNHSYLTWIADYITNLGYDRGTQLGDRLRDMTLQLSYKMAGFSDKKYLKVLAEHNAPDTSNTALFVPDEDYNVSLFKTKYIDKITLSAIIVEKQTNGWSISGYDTKNPFFTIIPSIENSNNYVTEVGSQRGIIYRDYAQSTATVQYGHEFKYPQDVFDFLISYGRYLESFGFIFDGSIGDARSSVAKDWVLAGKEFLFWSQQEWAAGSVIALSPYGSEVKLSRLDKTIVDEIHNNSFSSRVLDVNFNTLRNEDYLVKRIDNVFELKILNDAPIGLLDISTAQFEHVLVFNNITVFNDVLFEPASGNRQDRLKLIGYKTSWNGNLSAPGFIYNEDNILEWAKLTDYKKGDLVEYKSKFYYSKADVIGSIDFNFAEWQNVPANEIKTGLLRNLSSSAAEFAGFYDTDIVNLENTTDIFGKGLVGYRNRDYLRDLGLADVSQVKFYQGFIKEKGTKNALNKLFRAKLEQFSGEIDIFEEFALKSGSYGAIDIRQEIEIELPETTLTANPNLVEFLNEGDPYPTGRQGYRKSDIWLLPDTYTKNVFPNRAAKNASGTVDQFYKNSLQYAGFPRLDDVDATVFDLSTIATDLNASIDSIGAGYIIWVANDYRSVWNLFRVSETEITLGTITDNGDGTSTITTNEQHTIGEYDTVLIKNFLGTVDGFHRVTATSNPKTFIVDVDSSAFTTTTGDGYILKLESVRFLNTSEFAAFTPLLGWKQTETVWLETNADGKWETLQKTEVWSSSDNIDPTTPLVNSEFGHIVESSVDNSFVYVGSPADTTSDYVSGEVHAYIRDIENGGYATLFNINAKVLSAAEYGTGLSVAGDRVFMGAPGTLTERGIVVLAERSEVQYPIHQVLVAFDQSTSDRFGETIKVSTDERWLYVGAPTANKVYVYQLDDSLYTTSESFTGDGSTATFTLSTVPVSDEDVTLTGTTSSFTTDGAVITLATPPAGAFSVQQTNVVGVSQTFTGDGSTATFTLTGVNVSPKSIYHLLITDTATNKSLPFIDYTLSGNVITFTTAPAVGTFTVAQNDAYVYITTLDGAPEATVNSNFGYSIDCTSDGASIYVGSHLHDEGATTDAGSVWVYSRSIEAFSTMSNQLDFELNRVPAGNIRVMVDGVAQTEGTEYNLVVGLDGSTLTRVRFESDQRPNEASNVSIETNAFLLNQRIESPVAKVGGHFGWDLSSCTTDCSVYIGAPNADTGEIIDTGKVYRYGNQSRLYGTITGTTTAPTVTIGHSLRINNFEVVFTGTTLTNVITDITNKDIVGITASNVGDQLVITADSTINGNLLRIDVGLGTGMSDLGLINYVLLQTISQPANKNKSRTRFGHSLDVGSDVLVISSKNSAAHKITTFDSDGTYFDSKSTVLIDAESNSGAVYVYELKETANASITNAGSFVFSEELESSVVTDDDLFGFDVHMNDGYIYIGSRDDDTDSITNSGRVVTFRNWSGNKGWAILRSEPDLVDVKLINNTYMYNKSTRQKIVDLDFIDPFKDKHLGSAEEDITFKTVYDPARYNNGTNANVRISTTLHWSDVQVGRIWWDLSTVRYVWYEQGDLTYKLNNWGQVFPGSSIDMYEWTESKYLPSEYVANSGDGIPMHADDSAYVTMVTVDSVSGEDRTIYYYWVKDRLEIPNVGFRNLAASEIAKRIENPKGQGIEYLSFIEDNAIGMHNITSHLSENDIILHVDYDLEETDAEIHSEFELIRDGDPLSSVGTKFYNKLQDSLSGINVSGDRVPNDSLSISQRYGIKVRPIQSMFVNRLQAMKLFVEYVNSVCLVHPIVENRPLEILSTEETEPTIASSGHDEVVADLETLDFISTTENPIGYQVLVQSDSGLDNLWAIYELSASRTWVLDRVQSFDTTHYWEKVDWYATGYSTDTEPKTTVAVLRDIDTLTTLSSGDVVKITDNGNNQWQLVSYNGPSDYTTVGIENATIQILSSAYSYDGIGWDSVSFDSRRFDVDPRIETRYIFQSVSDELFTDDLRIHWNKSIMLLMNYILSEQKNLDWLFKTSFITVKQNVSELNQPSGYTIGNQDLVKDYIDEVKPYKTKIREYVSAYNKTDPWSGNVTDFDLPSYYDSALGRFRSPSGEETKDRDLHDQAQNLEWRDNHTYYVDSIVITDGGSGYLTAPVVSVGVAEELAANIHTRSMRSVSNAEMTYDATYVYIKSTGLPEHAYGPFPNDNDPNAVVAQDYVFKFRKTPVGGGFKVATPLGSIGVAVNGVPFFNASTGRIVVIGDDSYTENAVNASTHVGIDDGSGHPQEDGAYHYHSDPSLLYNKISTQHSPIVGWSFDGYPIYGPYGYKNSDGSGGIVRNTTSYRLRSGTRDDGDSFDGKYIEDYEFVSGLGTLDLYNGRTVFTPEYPSGTYAYFITVDADLEPEYPYILGPQYNGSAITNNGNELLPDATIIGRTDVVAVATISAGAVSTITVTTKGTGFLSAPVITITGGSGTGATAIAIIDNDEIRKIKPTIKFDRVSYTSDIVDWAAATLYTAGDIISYQQEAYLIDTTFTSGTTFDSTNMSVYSDENFTAANDRVMAYYKETSGLLGRDLGQLFDGINYPGTIYDGLSFSENEGFDATDFDSFPYDPVEIGDVGQMQLSSVYLDTILESQFSLDGSTITVLGTNPEDIIVDGDEFVSSYTSHAPQELVPGRIFDTLDIQVYQVAGAEQGGKNTSMNMYYSINISDSSTMAFSYNDPSDSLTVYDEVFVFTKENGRLIETTDYTLNRATKVLTLVTGLSITDTLYMYAHDTTGLDLMHEGIYTGDGSTAVFHIPLPIAYAQQALILVDGVRQTSFTLAADTTNSQVTLGSVPAANARIHIHVFNNSGDRAFTYPTTQVDASPAYSTTLTEAVQYDGPLEANIMVELNDTRLRPGTNAYYTSDGSTANYSFSTSAGDNLATLIDADIKVYVDGAIQTLTTHYTVTPFDGSTVRSVTFVTVPTAGALITLTNNTSTEYTLSDSTTLVIDGGVSLVGQSLAVTSFGNHDPLKLRTTVTIGDPYADSSFDLPANRTHSKVEYVYITLDGARLYPGTDFMLVDAPNASKVNLDAAYTLTSASEVVITTFSEDVKSSALGFRIFKDVLDTISYYRISDSDETTLRADLNASDTTIYVEDSSTLPTPDIPNNVPGIVMIEGERILYWAKDDGTDTLTNILRGTAGTRIKDTHATGTYVTDMSTRQVIIDAHDFVWYNLGTSSPTDGTGLANATSTQAQFIKDRTVRIPG